MSPLLKQLALELAAELRAAKDDPTAVDRIGDNVNRILYANHPELIAHEWAAQIVTDPATTELRPSNGGVGHPNPVEPSGGTLRPTTPPGGLPVNDFYGYVSDEDDITQYSDDGLRKAYAWAQQEMRDLAYEHDMRDDDPRASHTKEMWNRVADEMAKRQLTPLGGRW